MPDFEYRLSESVARSLSIETLLSVWKSILSQGPSSLTLNYCAISARRYLSSPPRLTLTVEFEPLTTSAAQILEDLALALVSSVQEATSKTSKTSSDPSSSPTLE